jgi:hypothetical protein
MDSSGMVDVRGEVQGSRVDVRTVRLQVGKGGHVNADERGWDAEFGFGGPGFPGNASTPICGARLSGAGGSYGGNGGAGTYRHSDGCVADQIKPHRALNGYGTVVYPKAFGSSGGYSYAYDNPDGVHLPGRGGAGGGAVHIAASDFLRLCDETTAVSADGGAGKKSDSNMGRV